MREDGASEVVMLVLDTFSPLCYENTRTDES